MSEHADRARDRHRAALERARSRWNEQALACARELIDDGATVLSVDGGTVRGQVVRFWRGDDVLELTSARDDGRGFGSSRTRLDRHRHMTAEVVGGHLIDQIAQLDAEPEPS